MQERIIHSVLLIIHKDKTDGICLCEAISSYLNELGISCDRFVYSNYTDDLSSKHHYDLVITLGGDGTVLYAARLLATEEVPIMPLNLATFGFITEILSAEWKETFHAFQRGEIQAYPRMLLFAESKNQSGSKRTKVRIMNDVVISSSNVSKLLRLSVYVGKDFLGRYRADGVIIATPTGSTAYSTAAGGPILYPEMDAIIVNPICPFTLSHRPLVLPAEETIRVVIEGGQRTDLVLSVDGQLLTQLREGDEITVRRSNKRAYILRSQQRSFYDVLRTKLQWSGGGE